MPDALIWPAVASIFIIILCIICLCLLRPALIRLIDRTSRAGKDGITFGPPQQREEPQLPPLSFEQLMKSPITATVLDREKTMESGLQSFNLKDEKETIALLIRLLATCQTTLEFHSTSIAIFGSQLYLLVRLAGTTQGISCTEAETIFKQAQDKFPDLHKNRTFSDWLNYLLTKHLIVQTNEKIDITQYGTDFLKYLVDA